MKMFDRLELSALGAERLAPLEALMARDWPDTWRDLAVSQFITLLSAPGAASTEPALLAQLAVALTLGIADDLGGTQPYIQAGARLLSSARARRIIELREQGLSYEDVAHRCGKISTMRVRQIEAAWIAEQRALRQGTLDLI